MLSHLKNVIISHIPFIKTTREKAMPILIYGTIDVAPENSTQALQDAKPLIEEALTEPGCLAYDWSLDPWKPGRLLVFEHWESESTLQQHFAADSYLKMLEHLGGVGIINAVTNKYRVDLAEPVYGPDGKPTAVFLSDTPST